MSNPDELITTREVAGVLGVSTREVARRVERGELKPAAKLPGIRGAFLFHRAPIDALVAEKEAS